MEIPYAVIRFAKYAAFGFCTFLIDLLLLYVLIDVWGVHYLVATGAAFLIAVTVNYVLSRRYVFAGSLRGHREGYVYFLLIVLAGFLMVTGGMYLLATVFGVHYMVARVVLAAVTGFWNYLMNLFVNFKVAGMRSGTTRRV